MWRMTAATYFTGWWVVRTLPEAVAYKAFRGIADFVFRRNGKNVQRLRKNLDATKKKLAEKTTAADKLQKSVTQARAENTQLEQKVKELEAQLAETNSENEDQAEEGSQAAA